jgi:RNA polymerase sigma factor (sigma-70 family)
MEGWCLRLVRRRRRRKLTGEFRAAPTSLVWDGYEPHPDANVTGGTLARARAGDEDAFRALTDPYRRELQLHVYRIVGSAQDAEDLVQETLLAAWRGLGEFEERASVRSWLYRIATNRSLDALRAHRRRLEDPRMAQMPEPTQWTEPLWLTPYPDVLLEGVPDEAPGPDARYESKEAIELAFIAGLQHLPPQQRAPLPNSRTERETIDRFADSVENGDIDGLVTLLTEDAWLTMPPLPHAYRGRDAIGAFLRGAEQRRGAPMRLLPSRANTQPAFACYLSSPDSDGARAFALFVLTLADGQISAITWFAGADPLAPFGLPQVLR